MAGLEVMMFGPSQVGKTSLLASMYYCVRPELTETNLVLEADDETEARLNERYTELGRLPASFVNRGGMIQRTLEPKDYFFHLKDEDSEASLKVSFFDYPGEHSFKRPEVRERLKNADAILIAIDTPALMESSSKAYNYLHDMHNSPTTVAKWLKSALESNSKPRLVILAMIRCERYLMKDRKPDELVNRVKAGYRDLLKFLDTKKELIAVVIMPVQTIGSVIFDKLVPDENSNAMNFLFKRKGPNATFSPADTEQPLRYVFRFLFSTVLRVNRGFERHAEELQKAGPDQLLFKLIGALAHAAGHAADYVAKFLGYKDMWKSWFGKLCDYLADNWRFRDRLEHFQKGCKTESPFVIVQGEDLLDL